MRRYKYLLVMIVCIVFLSGCNKEGSNKKNLDTNTNTPSNVETPDSSEGKEAYEGETINVLFPDLSNEEGIRDYLAGEWVFEKEYLSDVVCNMVIDNDLSVEVSFKNLYANEYPGEYSGKIILDRQYANLDKGPNIISFELEDDSYPGGDYFFLHRTNYDEKYVMSLFFAGNGNGIFDLLASVGHHDEPDEIIFEKISGQNSGELSQVFPRKNDQFYAVFWSVGEDEKSFWLDDVHWTGKSEYDFDAVYPKSMITYENSFPGSILYNIVPKQRADILGKDMFPGEVYYVETDENASIKYFIEAEKKKFIEEANEPEDYGYALFETTDIGIKKVIKAKKDVELTESSGPFTVSIKDIKVLDLNLFDGFKEDFDNKDKLTLVTMAVEIEHKSIDIGRIYPELSFIVTNNNERAEFEHILSDSFGGEFLGKSVRKGNLIFILESEAKNIEKISYIIEGPQDKNFNSISHDIVFEIEF